MARSSRRLRGDPQNSSNGAMVLNGSYAHVADDGAFFERFDQKEV